MVVTILKSEYLSEYLIILITIDFNRNLITIEFL